MPSGANVCSGIRPSDRTANRLSSSIDRSDLVNLRLTRFLANAGVSVLTLVIAFAFGEFVVRLLYKSKTVLFPRYHTDYQYGRYTIRGIRPNSEYLMSSVDGTWKFVTNDRGFRNSKPFTYAKPAGTFRVLSIGDSHTQGYEVRQELTFSAVLERLLRFHAKEAQVINAGVSGFGTAEELVFLENEGIKYSPDVVVLGFFANDFTDNVRAALFGVDDRNRLIEEKLEYVPGVRVQNLIYNIPVTQWLSENSYFYSLLFNNVWNYFKIKNAGSFEIQAAMKGALSVSAEGQFEYTNPISNSFPEYQIALAAALIERMHRFCATRGIRFIVVDIPRAAREGYGYDSSMPPELLNRLAAARVEIIHSRFLLHKFNEVAEMHVRRGDRHISEFTHTLIGVEIGERLLASGTGAKRK